MAIVDDDQLVDVLLALGCERLDVVERAGGALGRPDAVGMLALQEGVVLGEDHVRFGPEVAPSGRADPAHVAAAGEAAGDFLLELQDLEGAGRLAIAAGLAPLLRSVVRTTLRVHPPLLPAPTLRAWRDSGVLAPDDAHGQWLDAACYAAGRAPAPEVIARFEAVRQAFEDADDLEAEVSVGLAMAIYARRTDDVETLVRLVGRAGTLVAAGRTEPVAIEVLGRAVGQQLLGDSVAALATLEEFPPDQLHGDWGAQVSMIRGTNLMLLERHAEAVEAFVTASGYGGTWTYAVVLELLGTARWYLGDAVGAIDDLRWAEVVARDHGAVPPTLLAACHRAVFEAATGLPAASGRTPPEAEAILDDECTRLLAVAKVLRAVDDGDIPGATALVDALPVPDRAIRSAHWIVALRVALGAEVDAIDALVETHPTLAAASAAGHVARAHLAGGPRAPRTARHLLPARWCEPAPATIELRLVGDASVRVDGRPLAHPDWERNRVRELCLHLALVTDSSRAQVAARLWPDLGPGAADRNLRVTLSYLMKVLDPDRPRGAASELIDDTAGMLTFAATPRLRIDVRDALVAAEGVTRAAASGDAVGVARHTRQLLRLPGGSLLGGSGPPPWAERYDDARRELVLRAATTGAPVLVRGAHHALAGTLARRGLDEDPWAERLHMTVVRAHLARDDLDAARRAMQTALAALDEAQLRPERATLELAEVVGLETR